MLFDLAQCRPNQPHLDPGCVLRAARQLRFAACHCHDIPAWSHDASSIRLGLPGSWCERKVAILA